MSTPVEAVITRVMTETNFPVTAELERIGPEVVRREITFKIGPRVPMVNLRCDPTRIQPNAVVVETMNNLFWSVTVTGLRILLMDIPSVTVRSRTWQASETDGDPIPDWVCELIERAEKVR